LIQCPFIEIKCLATVLFGIIMKSLELVVLLSTFLHSWQMISHFPNLMNHVASITCSCPIPRKRKSNSL